MQRSRRKHETKAPLSTLEKVSRRILPDMAHRFLFGPPSDFCFARYLIGAVFGAISGTALFFGLMHNIPLSFDYKIFCGLAFVALCILGAMVSSYFRCSVLLMFPSILGSRGQAYVMLFVIQSLYQGPISNIQHNVQEMVFSVGCNIDLQITHSRLMWRTVSEPFFQVLQEIVDDSVQLQKEAQNVSRQFEGIRDEVMGQYGYDSFGQNLTATGNSTQEQYTAKTMLRCEYVVQNGIDRCIKWFDDTWLKCMDTIKSPVINHFLCVPMKFDFLCNIMRVMTPWCKEQIPVEGNFGQTFDKLSSSISKLGEQFTANLVLEKIEDQPILGSKVLRDDFREELVKAFKEASNTVKQIIGIVQILLSFTFITVFTSAFGYARQYTRDICFDNVYITTYFRQIDERRRKRGRRYLLPLKKTEKSSFIEPWRLKVNSNEIRPVFTSLVQVVSLVLFVSFLLVTDRILYYIFEIIRRHTYIEQSFESSHDIQIDISGDSMLAKLLRKTIGAFNTSSNLNIVSNNWQCLPQPHALSQNDYLLCIFPLLLMVLMCRLQVYTNRLRRVITTFYFPKREKKRILYLYNLQIQKRIALVNRLSKQLRRQRQAPKKVLSVLLSPLERWGWGVCWCWVCEENMWQQRAMRCSVVGCNALYCAQCWRDLGYCCICSFPTNGKPQDSDSDIDTVYYVY
ncbi:E3 ubiquitin-protein ligase DCST1 [Clarias gariepinus]|uniref:E3 ubiquitin-protein ligase DCST1 n=1 Tax=Clarias gariepinus TaxID=13013 RepID=UPI00234D9F29|nr:E3 ubiquitin-protein ligase DCST1 [Clarias gariepinus]